MIKTLTILDTRPQFIKASTLNLDIAKKNILEIKTGILFIFK